MNTLHKLTDTELLHQKAELYDFAPYGYFRLSIDGRITESNLLGIRMLDHQQTNAKNISFGFFVSEESKPVFNQFISNVFLSGVKETCEVIIPRDGHDSAILHLEGIVSGNREDCLMTAVDITIQKKTETTLKAQEEKYHLLLETAGVAIAVYTLDGKIELLNKKAIKNFGGNPENYIGKSLEEIFGKDTGSVYLNRILETAKSDKSLEFEDFIRLDTGNYWFLSNQTRIIDAEGNIIGVKVISHDITDRKLAEEKLRVRENMLSTIYNAVDDILFNLAIESATDYRFISINPAFSRITKLDADAVIGHLANEVIPEPTRATVLANCREAIKEKKTVRWESTAFYPAGRLVGEVSLTPVIDDNGNCTTLVGFVHVITERKEAEVALANSQAQLKAIYENSPVMICMLDTEINVQFANPAFAEFIGASDEGMQHSQPGNVIGCINSVSDPEGCGFGAMCDQCPLRMSLGDTVNSGISHNNFEFPTTLIQGTNSRDIVLLGSTSLIRENEGNQVLLCLVDITSRKQTEDNLQLSEMKYRNLVENALIGIYSKNADGTLLFANDAMGKMLGYDSNKELVGMNVRALYKRDEERIKFQELITASKKIFNYEVQLVTKNGKTIEALINAFALGDMTTGMVMDITDRKQAEDKILGMNEELERRVTERTFQMNTVIQELESFSYSVSHDLQAPLRAIDGFSKVILEDYAASLPEEARIYFMKIIESTQHMFSLINDLLNLAKVTRSTMNRVKVDLSKMVMEIFDKLKEQFPDRDVEIVIQSGLNVKADLGFLHIALENMISNAWKFTSKKEHAKIEFLGKKENGKTVFSLTDNGAGFDMKYKQKLFNVFQRLHTPSEFPGTGIGLAIVHRIIRQHGGEISAVSEVGNGSTFYFTLRE